MMDTDDLRQQIQSILHPEPDDDGLHYESWPHPRLSSEHGLDASYFRGGHEPRGDGAFERLLQDSSDPLHNTLESVSVPLSLISAALELFGDSMVAYHEDKRRWGIYRFYPPILTTMWSAFESWVRISSQIYLATAVNVPTPVRDALNETRAVVNEKGEITPRADRRPVLERYSLLLKYGCGLSVDRGAKFWQAGKLVEKTRNALVHYEVAEAPSLTASGMWHHMEAVFLLLIAPSCLVGRTLFSHQFDYYSLLVELLPLVSEFEERPLHKGWPKEALIFHCPFEGVDEGRYPLRWKPRP